jgi:putative DNA primase/helicase
MSEPFEWNPSAAVVKGDPAKAVSYMFGLPVNRITLTAITPDGPTSTATFSKTTDSKFKAIKWIAEQQAAGRNIYHQDCSVDSINKRPTKADVSLIHCAHVDIDVKGMVSPAGRRLALTAILAVLEGYKLPPTDIICTGNGMQAFWYIDKPLAGTPQNIEKIEAVNRALASDFGGDSCQDVAHLMRLPFTVNLPNKKKLGLGRKPVVANVVRENHGEELFLYRLDQLPSKPIETARTADFDEIDLPDSVDLSRLSDADRQTIKNGAKSNDRSAVVYAIACQMRRENYSDGEIVATITNPDNGISEHILDQKQRTPVAQAMRVIARMNAKGVKLPEFDDDFVAPEPTPEQSRLREDMARRKQEKQERQAKRRENIIKGLRVIRGDDIEVENLRFIWDNVLARGIHTAMAGEGGQGKSQVTYNIAASITKGGKLPDGKDAPKGSVVFLNAEDTTKQMFGPRLKAAGADMEKIYKVQSVATAEGPEQKFSLQNDLEKLKELCIEIGDVVLIVIDPASSYMGGTLDTRQNNQVRDVLDPISRLAEDLDCAVLSVNHFNKGQAGKAINRVLDSVANVNAPRAVWGVFPDPEDMERETRLFVQIKTNIANPNQAGWSYTMIKKSAGIDARDKKTPVMATCIKWNKGSATMSADQIIAAENERTSPRTDEAVRFLRGQIEDTNPPPLVEDVKRAAEAEGIAQSTLLTAKRKLGVKPVLDGPNQPWRWTLPKGRDLDLDDGDAAE